MATDGSKPVTLAKFLARDSRGTEWRGVSPQRTATDGHGSETIEVDSAADLPPEVLARHREYLSTLHNFRGAEDPLMQARPRGARNEFVVSPSPPSETPNAGQVTPVESTQAAFDREFRNEPGTTVGPPTIEGKELTSENPRDVIRAYRDLATDGRNQLGQDIARPQLARNRFTGLATDDANAKYIDESQARKSDKAHTAVTTNGSLGVYDPERTYAIEDMRKVGLELLLKAAGDSKAAENVRVKEGSPQVNAGQIASSAALPTRVQVGAEKVGQYYAKDTSVGREVGVSERSVLDFITDDSGGGSSKVQRSYGTLNSPIEPFEASLGLGMVPPALTGALTILAASEALLLLINSPAEKLSLAQVSPSTLGFGQSSLRQAPSPEQKSGFQNVASNLGSSLTDALGIPRTYHGFDASVRVGIATFFGLNNADAGTFGAVAGGLGAVIPTNVANSPGFIASITRTIIRDLEQVKNAFEQFGSGGRAANVIGMVRSITSSTLFRFVMTMARLGDVVLTSSDGALSGMGRDSRALQFGNLNRYNRLGKSRTSTQDSRTSWRASTAESLLMMPRSYLVAARFASSIGLGDASGDDDSASPLASLAMLSEPGAFNYGTTNRSNVSFTNSGRLSADEVEAFENRLDSEYWPFYFHDLRTNEIINFHAFLGSVTDGYTAQYQATQAFGRMDAVQTYASTTRQIGFDFHVVATNPRDFNVMWFKINKLVSLLYPQYSSGRVVNSTDDSSRFVLPFSQVYAASPMIRLRIGDMVRSNYSKFNLARLFGIGASSSGDNSDDYSFGFGGAAQTNDEIAAIEDELLETNLARGRNKPLSVDDDTGYASSYSSTRVIMLLRSLTTQLLEDTTAASGNDRGVGRRLQDALRAGRAGRDREVRYIPAGTKLTIVDKVQVDKGTGGPDSNELQSEILYLVRINAGEQDRMGLNDAGDAGTEFGGVRGVVADRRDADSKSLDGRQFFIDHDSLVEVSYSPVATGRDVTNQEFGEASTEFSNVNFFTKDNNAVVRSFASTQGRGLAGFITSMNFDYSEFGYNVDRKGSRAPMGVKITMQFVPIHDLPMGLDADGAMVSTPYPVGDVVRSYSGHSRE